MQQTLSSLEVRSPGTLVPGYRFILYYSLLLDALQILPPSLVAWLAKLGLAPSREWLLVLAKGVNKVAMVILVPWGLFWVAGVSHALFGVRGTGEGEGSAPKDEPSKLALSSMPFGALPIVLNWWGRSRSDQALELPSSLTYLSTFYLVLIMVVLGRLTLAAVGATANPRPHPKQD